MKPDASNAVLTLLMVLSASLMGGCASVSDPGNDRSRVLVTTSCGSLNNVGAVCRISAAGWSTHFETPGELNVVNSWRPYVITCQGDLLGSVSSVMMPKPNWGMAGNVLVGGLPGIVVDAATGRGLNYDRQVNLHSSNCLR